MVVLVSQEINTNEVRWGNPENPDNPDNIKSGLRFDGQSVSSAFGQEFCLGKLTHFNWPISHAASGATLKVTLDFSTPALPDATFTYQMGIDETSERWSLRRTGSVNVPIPPAIHHVLIKYHGQRPHQHQTFTIGDDTYTLQILGIKIRVQADLRCHTS